MLFDMSGEISDRISTVQGACDMDIRCMPPQWYRALDPNGRRAFWSSFAGFSVDAMDVQLYALAMQKRASSPA